MRAFSVLKFSFAAGVALLSLLLATPSFTDVTRLNWTPQMAKVFFQTLPVFNKNRYFEEKDVPDMSGKTVLITGGNSGLGFETARVLAEKNAKVVIGCRSEKRAQEAIDKIKGGKPGAQIEFELVDMASFGSIKTFAGRVQEKYPRIDVLVFNAGKMMETPTLSSDGFEWMFGAHHMGHFYLTHLLGEELKKGADEGGEARVVVISSCAHQMAGPKGIDFDELKVGGKEGEQERVQVYGVSKLANVLFARKLAKLVEDSSYKNKIFVNSVHPGGVRTEFSENLRWAEKTISWFTNLILYSGIDGALTQIFLASSSSPLARKGDGYFFPIATPADWERDTSPFTQDWDLIEKLWRFSVEESKKIDKDFETAF